MSLKRSEEIKGYSPGANLGHPNIQVINAKDAETLQEALSQLTIPYNIVSIYGMNGRHFAWIETVKKTRKVRRK